MNVPKSTAGRKNYIQLSHDVKSWELTARAAPAGSSCSAGMCDEMCSGHSRPLQARLSGGWSALELERTSLQCRSAPRSLPLAAPVPLYHSFPLTSTCTPCGRLSVLLLHSFALYGDSAPPQTTPLVPSALLLVSPSIVCQQNVRTVLKL